MEEESPKEVVPRSSTLDPSQNLVKKEISKAKFSELKNLRELRGTMNMPKV